jgi:predicted 2-oxoglutarate/Fe(II)-dependent dioxygenase YbiX
MITNDLKHYIKNYKGFIDKDICNKTIQELNYKEDEFRQHTFYNQTTQTSRTLSGNKELDITGTNTTTKKLIMDKIWHRLSDYMKYINLPYFDGWSGYSDIRWNRYKETRKMAEHCDHIQSLFEGPRKGVPILSCLGSLNDDYEGGELVFFGDTTIEFKQGDLLIFPSNFLYPHRVEPVISGVRWSYISWVW